MDARRWGTGYSKRVTCPPLPLRHQNRRRHRRRNRRRQRLWRTIVIIKIVVATTIIILVPFIIILTRVLNIINIIIMIIVPPPEAEYVTQAPFEPDEAPPPVVGRRGSVRRRHVVKALPVVDSGAVERAEPAGFVSAEPVAPAVEPDVPPAHDDEAAPSIRVSAAGS